MERLLFRLKAGLETRSFPNSLVAYPGDFTSYVARPGRSVHSRAESFVCSRNWTAGGVTGKTEIRDP